MLEIYEKLFAGFSGTGITYSVFKSLEHLDGDLLGEDGRDLDVWIARDDVERGVAIALDAGFFRVRWSSARAAAFILIGWDIPSGRKALLHIHFLPIGVKKRSLLPLYFLYQKTPSEIIAGSMPAQVVGSWCDEFEADRKSLKANSTLRLLRMLVTDRAAIAKLNFRFSFRETARIYVTYIHRFLFLRGRYKIGGGKLVAFTGIDGSGKTSVVEHLAASDFLRSTQGVKMSYFGNKNFWIPGLSRAVLKHRKATPIGIVVMGLSLVDRKLRIVPALAARGRGRIVLCDRYFYDQNIGDPTENYFTNRAVKAILNPIVSWIPRLPDVTFYMQVPPKVAYQRKQDYEFEKVERTAAAYDALLVGRPEVEVVDSARSIAEVQAVVRAGLVELYKTGTVRNGAQRA